MYLQQSYSRHTFVVQTLTNWRARCRYKPPGQGREIMTKTFEINGRTFAVVSYIGDDNCYRLVALPTPDADPDGYGSINLIDDTACEDYYGDIDTVADIMKEVIREEAEKPYPWWTLLGAVFEWGSDPMDIEDEETARSVSDVIANATILGTVDMDDEYEAEIAKTLLNLDYADVTTIHTFVNGSAGSFSLKDEWF